MKSKSVTIQMKATEQCHPLVLFADDFSAVYRTRFFLDTGCHATVTICSWSGSGKRGSVMVHNVNAS